MAQPNERLHPSSPLEGWIRPSATFAVTAISVFWIVTFVFGFVQPGYSHIEHAVSALGMVGSPYGWIQRANLVLLGLAMFAFAFALHRSSSSFGLFALFLVYGLGRMGEGIVAWDPSPAGAHGNLVHMVSGMLAVMSMILAPFAVSWMMRGAGISLWLFRYTLTTVSSSLVCFLSSAR